MSVPAAAKDVSLGYLLGDNHNKQQPEFILGSEFEICWVGGLGCGKSYAGCICALRHGIKYGRDARILIGRRTFGEAEGTIKQDFYDIVRSKQLVHLFDRPKDWDWREGTNFARMKNGAEFMFGNLQSADKLKNFQWSCAVVDQLEEVPWDVYQMLLQRVRWTGVPGHDRHVWSIANDEGDNWIRRRFLTYDPPHGIPSKDAGRKLIRGISFDNPHLDTTARAQLLAMPKDWQQRYIYAEMSAGTVRLIPDLRIIEPFDVPRHWPRWLGIDPARSTGVTAALWVTVNPDEATYKGVAPNAPHFYQEYGAEGRDAEVHAEKILGMNGANRLQGRIMDQSAWYSTTKSKKLGSLNTAQFYLTSGLAVSPSSGDEWVRVQLFHEAQKRGLTVARTCEQLIRQAPEYRVKGQRAPDGRLLIKAKQHFHWVDAGGYALSALPTRVAPVDIREIRPAYDIAENADEASRQHWEMELRQLPMMKGRESVISTGFDEDEFHREDMVGPEPGRRDDLSW